MVRIFPLYFSHRSVGEKIRQWEAGRERVTYVGAVHLVKDLGGILARVLEEDKLASRVEAGELGEIKHLKRVFYCVVISKTQK